MSSTTSGGLDHDYGNNSNTAAAATTTTATAKTAARPSSLATSVRFKAFAVTFALVSTLMYLACEWFNLPAFTYHPATNRVGWWWEAGRSGQGPAMYWYGWSATDARGRS